MSIDEQPLEHKIYRRDLLHSGDHVRNRQRKDQTHSSKGMCITDVDGVYRVWGDAHGLDGWGRFAFVEYKLNGNCLTDGEYMTYEIIDDALRDNDRYCGTYMLNFVQDGDSCVYTKLTQLFRTPNFTLVLTNEADIHEWFTKIPKPSGIPNIPEAGW